jgi:hypothetical protein
MQRSFLCASVSIGFLLVIAPVEAGDGHAQGHGKHHRLHHVVTPPARPAVVSAGAAAQTPILVARPAQPSLIVPLTEPTGSRRIVAGVGEAVRPHHASPTDIALVAAERPLQPVSFNPTDPRAVITRLPSGRIAMSPPAGFYPLRPWEVAESNRRLHPYAQPSFQIIGGGAPQRAAGAVQLTYGIKPGRRMNPEPRVVWLDERGRAPEASPHIRHIR